MRKFEVIFLVYLVTGIFGCNGNQEQGEEESEQTAGSDSGDPTEPNTNPVPNANMLDIDDFRGNFVVPRRLVANNGTIIIPGCDTNSHPALLRISVAPFARDSSFGNNGATSTAGRGCFTGTLRLQDDKLFAFGYETVAGDNEQIVISRTITARFMENGLIDESYGIRGVLGVGDYKSIPRQVVQMRDNTFRMLVDGEIVALVADGNINTESIIEHPFESAKYRSVLLLQDGSLLVTGSVPNYGAALYRFFSDGRLDREFGPGRRTTLDSGLSAFDAVGLISSGRIVAAGSVRGNQGWKAVTCSFDPFGALDDEFGRDGCTSNDSAGGVYSVSGTLDGRILLGGTESLVIGSSGDLVDSIAAGADGISMLPDGTTVLVAVREDSTRIALYESASASLTAVGDSCGQSACAGGQLESTSSGVPWCNTQALGTQSVALQEACDGVDNDCDGETDEIPPRPAEKSLGVCEGQVAVCDAGSWNEPDYASVERYEDRESLCDGFDNDCDGTVDGDGVCTVCVGKDSNGLFDSCDACDFASLDCDTFVLGSGIRRGCGCSEADDCPCGMICGSIRIGPNVTVNGMCTIPNSGSINPRPDQD